MKYAVIIVSNGNFRIESEHSDLNSAKVKFHEVCESHWNAPAVLTAEVMIADEQLDAVDGYKEFIHHDPVPAAPEVVEGE